MSKVQSVGIAARGSSVMLLSASLFTVTAAATCLARVQAHPLVRNANSSTVLTGLAIALVLNVVYLLTLRLVSPRQLTSAVLGVLVLGLVVTGLWNGFATVTEQTESISAAIYVVGAPVPLAIAHSRATATDEFDLHSGIAYLPIVGALFTAGSLFARLVLTDHFVDLGSGVFLLLSAGLFAIGLGAQLFAIGRSASPEVSTASKLARPAPYLVLLGAMLFLTTFATEMWQWIQQIGWLELSASGSFRSTLRKVELVVSCSLAVLLQLLIVGRLLRTGRAPWVLVSLPVVLVAGIGVVYLTIAADFAPEGQLRLLMPAILGVLAATLQNSVVAGVIPVLFLALPREYRRHAMVSMMLWLPGIARVLSEIVRRGELTVSVYALPLASGVALMLVTIVLGLRFRR